MERNIKLLALDLDGTTLRSDNTLSARVRNAIERAVSSGIEVVVASGRPFASMPSEVLHIKGIRYVIASNGAAIYENGKRIHSVTIRESDALSLLELTKEHDLIWEAFLEGETCTDKRYYDNPVKYGCGEAYVDYVRNSRGCAEDMRAYIYQNRRKLDSVELVSVDKALRKRIWSAAEKHIGGLYITSSSENFVEFMDGSATKSNAVKWLCERLAIDVAHTAAAGNADNDADMIHQAGLGAAVRNACKSCMKAADMIIPGNDDDGVAVLIEYIVSGYGS